MTSNAAFLNRVERSRNLEKRDKNFAEKNAREKFSLDQKLWAFEKTYYSKNREQRIAFAESVLNQKLTRWV